MERPYDAPVALIVEDDGEVLRLLGDFCEEAGFSVVARTDGRAARAWLERSPVPALVILDLSIPLVTGLDLLTWMRRQPALASVPVVLASGTDQHELLDLACHYGATEILPKPLTLARLLEVIPRFTPQAAGC